MRVAIAQITVDDEDVKKNLKKIREIVEGVEADLIVFPEYSTSMTKVLDLEDLSCLLEATKRKTVIIGTPFREGDRKYDAALVLRDGEVIAVRRKRYLFRPLGEDFDVGELPFPLEIGQFKMKIIICYELRFPELFWDADVFIVIGAWPLERIEHWRTLLKARAIESLAYVVGVNRWGRGIRAFFGGNSCAFDPWGEPLACLGVGEGLALFNLEPSRLREARSFVAFEDRGRVRREVFDSETER